MKRVAYSPRVKAEFVSSDLKWEVAMDSSVFEPMLHQTSAGEEHPKLPLPRAEVNDIIKIGTRASFDLVAVVHALSPSRSVATPKGPKQVSDINLVDGSQTADGTVAKLVLSCWDPPVKSDAFRPGVLVALFGLSANRTADGLSVNTVDDTVIVTDEAALRKTARGAQLWSKRQELADLAPGTMQQLGGEFARRQGYPFDVNEDKATLTCAHLLESMAEDVADEAPVLLQDNWVSVEVPQGSVVTKNGERIWFQTTLRDLSGETEASVNQEAALQLTGCETKDGFQAKAASGDLRFPLLANIRLVRSVAAPKAVAGVDGAGPPFGSQESTKHVNLVVVAAAETNVLTPPTAAMHDLRVMLTHCSKSSSGMLVAALSEIHRCPYYGLNIRYSDGTERSAKSVLALVISSAKSTLLDIGDGYKVTTLGIKDALGSTSDATDHSADTIAVTGFCGLDDVLNFKLDPPRGPKKTRMAAILVTSVGEAEFVISDCLLVEEKDQETAKASFQAMRELAKSIEFRGTSKLKRRVDWAAVGGGTPLTTPKKCREISRYPTDP